MNFRLGIANESERFQIEKLHFTVLFFLFFFSICTSWFGGQYLFLEEEHIIISYGIDE